MAGKILLVLSLLINQVAFSQTDSVLFAGLYEPRSATNPAEPIFNGREHVLYQPQITGTPYFDSSGWQKGTIVYQNILYKNVSMKYDLVADELIVFHVNGYSRVILVTPWIQYFTIGDKKFIYLKRGQAPLSRDGIYQELVNGKVSLYAKRTKLIAERTSTFALEKEFESRDAFFVLMEGRYHRVSTRKEIMALVKDKKSQIRARLKAAGLRPFRPNRDLAMTKIIEYYNELSR